MFLDETAITTKLARTHARSFRGTRAVGRVPGSWKKASLVAAVRRGRILAAQALRGSFRKPTFRFWVERFLAPELVPGDVVVMDNLKVHDQLEVRRAIEARGAIARFLPPYSPDLNPIEEAWSKLKALLRARAPRTLAEVYNACDEALPQITPSDIDGWFCHAYPSLIP